MPTDRHRLLAAAHRLLNSSEDAEDAVQDTFVRALTAFPRGAEVPAAWVHTVMRNIAIDKLRRRQWETEPADGDSPSEESLEGLMEVRSTCEAALRLMLRRISPPEASALLLREVFELDFDEIGQLLNRTEAAARQFVHRAKIRARESQSRDDWDDSYVGIFWSAIETRNLIPLMQLLHLTTAQAHPAAAIGPTRKARSISHLVQLNGHYAIALMLDGIVLCLVPLNSGASLMDETAR